jgi:undecaprenyl diphosphate synthase
MHVNKVDQKIGPKIRPDHIGIIMDGNGRWAEENGHSRLYGHACGAQNLENTISYIKQQGVKYLTVFAMSCENFDRPAEEVSHLLHIFEHYLISKINLFHENNIKVSVIGCKNRIPDNIKQMIENLENLTKNNNGLHFTIAFDYGGKQEFVSVVKNIAIEIKNGNKNIDDISEEMLGKYFANTPPIDLLIRTSGEQRISNFMLWHCAYSELYFDNTYWPDFSSDNVDKAIEFYSLRNRRFGKAS